MPVREDLRNVAIIAHVDHGKTTLTDALMRQTGAVTAVGASMDSNALEQERGIVMEERRLRIDNDAGGAMNEALYLQAFVRSPYRWNTVGFMSDLRRITLAQARDEARAAARQEPFDQLMALYPARGDVAQRLRDHVLDHARDQSAAQFVDATAGLDARMVFVDASQDVADQRDERAVQLAHLVRLAQVTRAMQVLVVDHADQLGMLAGVIEIELHQPPDRDLRL